MTTTTVTDEQISAAQAGDAEAMWQIVSAYDPMMKSVVRSVASGAKPEASEDLLQEARAVLIQHVRDYDSSSSSAQLYTYAYRAIRRAVTEEWVRSTTALTVDPTTVLRVKRALWNTEGDIEGAWMIVSSDIDPRKRMSRELFLATVEALAETWSLDTPAHPQGSVMKRGSVDEAWTLAETIPDSTCNFTESAERRQLARFLLCEIPQRESLTLRAFHGIGMTQVPDTDVAADMGITTAYVRKLRQRGIESARAVAISHEIAA